MLNQSSNEWVQYQPARNRDKRFYDIKLRDGEVVECCYPNGGAWYPMHPDKRSKHFRIRDYRVVAIRVCPNPEADDETTPMEA